MTPAAGRSWLRRGIGFLALSAVIVWSQLPPRAAGPPLVWESDLEAGLAAARAAGRPALLNFWADWCPHCRRLDLRTLRDPAVAAELDRFVLVRIDVSAWDARALQVMDRFGVGAVPALVLIGPDGLPRRDASRSGYRTRSELIPALRSIPGGAPER